MYLIVFFLTNNVSLTRVSSICPTCEIWDWTPSYQAITFLSITWYFSLKSTGSILFLKSLINCIFCPQFSDWFWLSAVSECLMPLVKFSTSNIPCITFWKAYLRSLEIFSLLKICLQEVWTHQPIKNLCMPTDCECASTRYRWINVLFFSFFWGSFACPVFQLWWLAARAPIT